MSYDLFFRYRTAAPEKKLDVEAFQAWFGERPCFTLTGEDRARAWYENEDTGIYFSFDWSEREKPAPLETPVSFNLNFCRPHTFGLEAEDELDAFVKHFDLTVSDPQSDGMGDGEWSTEGFLEGWNSGNTWATRSMVADLRAMRRPAMPAARLEAIWRWNRIRNVYQEHFAEIAMLPCFVPKIIAVEDGEGGAQSAVVWGGGIAIALPDVDGALIVPSVREDGLRWVAAEALARILGPRAVQPVGHRFEHFEGERFELSLPVRVLSWDEPAKELLAALDAAGEPFRRKGIAWDQVMDAELLETPPSTPSP